MGQFLVDHEPCGSGFDVSHPGGPGSGIVSMACRGCGERFDYATTTIEIEREIEFEPSGWTGEAPTDELKLPQIPPTPTPPSAMPIPKNNPTPMPKKPPAKTKRSPRTDRRRERNTTLISSLVAFALAALAVATIRLATDDEPQTAVPVPTQTAGSEKPQGASPPAQAQAKPRPQGVAAHKASSSAPDPQPAISGAATALAGERLVEAPRFSLAVPANWGQGEADGGMLLAPTGAAPVSVQVFYEENPGLTMSAMIAETGDFLRSRSAGGTVGRPRRLRVDGSPAFELSKPGPLGSQTALGIVYGSFRYLVVAGENQSPPRSDATAAERALRSFRPR